MIRPRVAAPRLEPREVRLTFLLLDRAGGVEALTGAKPFTDRRQNFLATSRIGGKPAERVERGALQPPFLMFEVGQNEVNVRGDDVGRELREEIDHGVLDPPRSLLTGAEGPNPDVPMTCGVPFSLIIFLSTGAVAGSIAR